MSDLQAALEDVPFASTSQLAAPARPTSALFSRGPATPIPENRTPAPTSPTMRPRSDFQNYNQFAQTFNSWRDLVDTVGIEQAGLPPRMEYVHPNEPSPSPIEVRIPPRVPSRFSAVGNGLRSPPSPRVHLPYTPSQRPQLHMNIPPIRGMPDTSTKGLGKSISAKPDMYDGDKSKYVQWSRQLAVYFAGFDSNPNDTQKILITLSYMKGNNAAGRFADLYVQQKGDQIRLTLYSEFKTRLDGLFMPAALKRQAENELFKLKQGRETVEDYFVRMNQLMLQAEYSPLHHSRILINIARRGLKNEVIEFVERGQPTLLINEDFDAWVDALIQADQVLREIEDRKRGSWEPKQRYGTAANWPTTKPSTPANPPTTSTVHPNQVGTFVGQGVPMDIGKARAEGKCFKCGQPWPCKEHFKPRARQVRTFTFKGRTINYTNHDELVEEMKKVEQDFPVDK